MNDIGDEEDGTYQRHLDNLQEDGGSDFGGGVYSDEAKLKQQYIDDALFDEIANGILSKMCLTKKTSDSIRLIARITSSNDVVLSNLSERGMYREKLGIQLAMVQLNTQISAIERKYCDINILDTILKIHHATKLGRSLKGFERNAQITNVTSHTQKSILQDGNNEPPKSGFSRFGIRRQ